ncbi:MAG TPA: acyl-[acyl-carrier-protein]--UDP-N-acetylglucosamine O-acyltransferase [Cyanobacteria bacterium UBA8530]|nr:acyl-[acyl-carrier-protein]--UDP-N-acetylglucosamine O-acyltransferase [Cyanobacteria bacterium UBA8530]
MIEVHPQAVIHPSSHLGEGVRIGPYAVIGENCRIGEGTVLGPHAVIEPNTTIGRFCTIASGAVIGGIPQDLKYQGEETYTSIGDRNVIRECVTINRATGAGQETRIGNDNLLMAYVHIAHNCVIGDGVVIANSSLLAGHVEIEDFAVIGGACGIHQFVRVGKMAMVGAMSKIVQDLPPFLLCDGNPPTVFGPNSVGLKRRGLSTEVRMEIKRAFKLLYRDSLNLSQAIEKIQELQAFPEILHLLHFLEKTERGLIGIAKHRACLEAKD